MRIMSKRDRDRRKATQRCSKQRCFRRAITNSKIWMVQTAASCQVTQRQPQQRQSCNRVEFAYHGRMKYIGLRKQALQPVLLLRNYALCLIYGINVLVKRRSGQGPLELLPTRPFLPINLHIIHQGFEVLLLTTFNIYVKS